MFLSKSFLSLGLSFPNYTIRGLDPLTLKVQSITGSLYNVPNNLPKFKILE